MADSFMTFTYVNVGHGLLGRQHGRPLSRWFYWRMKNYHLGDGGSFSDWNICLSHTTPRESREADGDFLKYIPCRQTLKLSCSGY